MFVLFFLTSCWTYGLLIPSGLFVPALMTGAIYGRLVGEIIYFYDLSPTYPGTYALIGAAAFLGGVVRMTISLTVIICEATDQLMFALPVMTVPFPPSFGVLSQFQTKVLFFWRGMQNHVNVAADCCAVL